MDKKYEYILAAGPTGLETVLGELLTKSKADPIFAAEPHYILYELGNQRSLIKVDTSRSPFYFWHFDLMGRPATMAIKEVIVRFLWEKCGIKQQYLERNLA